MLTLVSFHGRLGPVILSANNIIQKCCALRESMMFSEWRKGYYIWTGVVVSDLEREMVVMVCCADPKILLILYFSQTFQLIRHS